MSAYRVGAVYCFDILCGRIQQDENGFSFFYDPEYLKNPVARPISLSMPLRAGPYISKTLHPFFDGLIPEGWLLDIAAKNWKLNHRDRMGLLLALCRDCIGAVHVLAVEESTQHA